MLLAVMLVVDLAWLFLGAALTGLFRSPASNRAVNLAFAVLLVLSVGFALLV